jgi:predicted transcriptional regulator
MEREGVESELHEATATTHTEVTMSIEKLMHKDPIVQLPTASCHSAAELMRDESVGSIVVVEDEEPVGVVTDRDLVTRVMAANRDPREVTLREVMSVAPIFLSKQRSLDEAVNTMKEFGVRRLPVVDGHNRPIGVLSLDDVLIHLAHQLSALGQAVERELTPPVEARG